MRLEAMVKFKKIQSTMGLSHQAEMINKSTLNLIESRECTVCTYSVLLITSFRAMISYLELYYYLQRYYEYRLS